MTNPNNMVRIRSRNGGRASVYEANAWAQTEMTGIIYGHGVTENTTADMNVLIGGTYDNPDIVIAQNPAGYKVALDIVSKEAIAITPPATNSRFSVIVAYTDDLSVPTTEDTVTGSPASCGLIVVNGVTAASPSAPTDSDIRAAITADGGSGSQAAYCTLAYIKVASTDSVITNSKIHEHFGAGIRGFSDKELIVWLDGTNGDDNNDGFMNTTAFKTLDGLFSKLSNCGGMEVKIRMPAGGTYTLHGYIDNGISIHFQPQGSGTTTLNITTLGSSYAFAFYNAHLNFAGSSTAPIVVSMNNTTTNDSTFYLDSGNMAAAYTTFNCGVTLWGAQGKFENCTFNRKLRLEGSNATLNTCTCSAIQAESANVDFYQATINTNKSDSTQGYYWNMHSCTISFYGSTYVNIDSVPSVANFWSLQGSTLYLGAVFNKNNSSTKKFSGISDFYGSFIAATQARFTGAKNMATTNNVGNGTILTSGVS